MSVASFNSMKYLKACVMETFRMYPTADQVSMFFYLLTMCGKIS